VITQALHDDMQCCLSKMQGLLLASLHWHVFQNQAHQQTNMYMQLGGFLPAFTLACAMQATSLPLSPHA
jgi:hypothetical protein